MPNEQRDKTKKNNRDVGAPFGRPQITNIVLSIIAIIAIVTLIIGRINDNKNLDKIIYNAKKEAEQTLISSGLATYTKDIDNGVGAISIASNENLPENTTETPQGTVVKPKENWNIETVKAISVGNGDTVPVPIGFYYVGGDLNTGVIISDEKVDEYDGETDKTTYEYTINLKGNQFVWIPCTEENYVKTEEWSGSTYEYANWERTTKASELPQIRKYEGFYVGRYEAGLAETITEFTSAQQNTLSNQAYNLEGIPQSKAGIVPWNFIDWNHAQTNAKNMYNTVSVSSGLITGTQWDVMLKTFVGKEKFDGTHLTDEDLINSESWGNFCSNSIEYTGRIASIRLSSRPGYQYAFGGRTTSKTTSYGSNNGDLLTTGASKQTEVYHIFDVAGNLWEWTDEVSSYATTGQYRVIRGGECADTGLALPACFRMGNCYTSRSDSLNGFRVSLYLK